MNCGQVFCIEFAKENIALERAKSTRQRNQNRLIQHMHPLFTMTKTLIKRLFSIAKIPSRVNRRIVAIKVCQERTPLVKKDLKAIDQGHVLDLDPEVDQDLKVA